MSNQDPPSASQNHAYDRYNQIQAKQELMSMLLEENCPEKLKDSFLWNKQK